MRARAPPQVGSGVLVAPLCQVVNRAGRLAQPFAGLTEVGEQVRLQWVIYFPWDREERKFKGEMIYAIRCSWHRPLLDRPGTHMEAGGALLSPPPQVSRPHAEIPDGLKPTCEAGISWQVAHGRLKKDELLVDAKDRY